MRLKVVEIDESRCIGCTKCIKACPTDAIIGAAKQLHGVLTDYCIGCMLCLPPCPVDCIEVKTLLERPTHNEAVKKRIKARKERLQAPVEKVKDVPVVDFESLMKRIQNKVSPLPLGEVAAQAAGEGDHYTPSPGTDVPTSPEGGGQ
jgi:Fe-S-cluster-containing hydrogenase component 2